MKSSSNAGRLVSIDALRGVAALGVVLYHAVLQTTNAVPNNLFRWPVQAVQLLSSFGYIGVFLFFVISGFCIHLQWARNYAAGDSTAPPFLTFWKRRVRRLYPPYIVAFGLFILMAAYSVGINVTHFFVYDVVMHLLMLHNLDPNTCYSINGVFWTLAIEEQLYLAYFLLLFLRRRWGWGPTLLICALARIGWFSFSHIVWLYSGVGIPVPEGALAHWFTWALGAMAVEAYFGVVALPRWCRNLPLGFGAIVLASVISTLLPLIPKDNLIHDGAWMLMHPLWGFGFFVVVNRAVSWERQHQYAGRIGRVINGAGMPRLVAMMATIGVFSYSLYLTHELVIMQSWRFTTSLPPILNTWLVLTPATIVFAWLFYGAFEKPFMRKPGSAKSSEKHVRSETSFAAAIPAVDEV